MGRNPAPARAASARTPLEWEWRWLVLANTTTTVVVVSYFWNCPRDAGLSLSPAVAGILLFFTLISAFGRAIGKNYFLVMLGLCVWSWRFGLGGDEGCVAVWWKP